MCKDPKLSAGSGIVVSGPERTVTVRMKAIDLFFADAKRFLGYHCDYVSDAKNYLIAGLLCGTRIL
jgi:hypothetical protein